MMSEKDLGVATDMEDMRWAIADFICEIHPLLPSYWYSIRVHGLSSLPALFGFDDESNFEDFSRKRQASVL
jgi:hypothetical protein